jgi:hypothetical protein
MQGVTASPYKRMTHTLKVTVHTHCDWKKKSKSTKIQMDIKTHEDGIGLDWFVPKVTARRASEEALWKKTKERDIPLFTM